MFGFYCRLPIYTDSSDSAVIRAIWKKLAPEGKSRDMRDARRKLYTQILEYHHNMQGIVTEYRL